MARLIDADEFERFLMNLPDEVLCEDCCYVVVNEMRKQPTIEAVPVKHGKWNAVPNRILVGRRVATQGTAWECSACNNSSKQYLPTMKFCPNCGAKMDGE